MSNRNQRESQQIYLPPKLRNRRRNEDDKNDQNMTFIYDKKTIGDIVKERLLQPVCQRPPQMYAAPIDQQFVFKDLPSSLELLHLDHYPMTALDDSYKPSRNEDAKAIMDYFGSQKQFRSFSSSTTILLRRIKDWTEEMCHVNQNFSELRSEIMSACRDLSITNLKYLTFGNGLSDTYGSCFGEFIKRYRLDSQKFKKNNPGLYYQLKRNHSDELMIILCKEGLNFFVVTYRRMLKHHSMTYEVIVHRNRYFLVNSLWNSYLHDFAFIIKTLLIYCGDMMGFIEQAGVDPVQAAYLPLDDDDPSRIDSKLFYTRAYMIVPKNVYVCKQLALVSYCQQNYLDAIYYNLMILDFHLIHDRCSAKFHSKSVRIDQYNRENLSVFFDCARKEYTQNLNRIKQNYEDALERINERLKRWENEGYEPINNKNQRMEYFPTSNNRCDLLEYYEKQILPKITFSKMEKEFIGGFLSVQCILNYRAAEVDHYEEICNKMVIDYKRLLLLSFDDVNPSGKLIYRSERISSYCLVQLFVINMYSVAHTHGDHLKDSASYGFAHSNAYFIMATMISIILKRLIKTFKSFQYQHDLYMDMMSRVDPAEFVEKFQNDNLQIHSIDDLFGSIHNTMLAKEIYAKPSVEPTVQLVENEWIEFYTLLPCLKLWCDWIISFNPYFPPHAMNNIKSDITQNVWQIFAEFLTLMNRKITRYPIDFYVKDKTKPFPGRFGPTSIPPENELMNYELIRLPEDHCLENFELLKGSLESSKYVKKPFVSEIVYIYLRLETIRLTGESLCESLVPVMEFNRTNRQYRSLIKIDSVEKKPGFNLEQQQQRSKRPNNV